MPGAQRGFLRHSPSHRRLSRCFPSASGCRRRRCSPGGDGEAAHRPRPRLACGRGGGGGVVGCCPRPRRTSSRRRCRQRVGPTGAATGLRVVGPSRCQRQNGPEPGRHLGSGHGGAHVVRAGAATRRPCRTRECGHRVGVPRRATGAGAGRRDRYRSRARRRDGRRRLPPVPVIVTRPVRLSCSSGRRLARRRRACPSPRPRTSCRP